MVNKLKIDWFMFAIAAGLSLFGAEMVYSASAMIALRESQERSSLTFISSLGSRSPAWR